MIRNSAKHSLYGRAQRVRQKRLPKGAHRVPLQVANLGCIPFMPACRRGSRHNHHRKFRVRVAQTADGVIYWFAGKAQEAEHWLRIGLKLSSGSSMGRAFLVRLLLSAGRNGEAREMTTTDLPSPIDYFFGTRGTASAASGEPDSALPVVRDLETRAQSEYVDRSALVLIYAIPGDWDNAFAAQAKALEERSPMAAFFPVDPLFEPVRSDRRFCTLAQQGVRA